MKKVKYFLFSLICLFSCSIVFAENEIVIKSITPVYDEASSIVVTEEENSHSVVFNDKDQSVEYKIVLENTTDKDLPVESVELSTPSEDFLVYELEGLDSDDIIEANSTKEIVISLETIKKEGWGRNFDDELIATFNFEKINLSLPDQIIDNITNPNTTDLIILVIGAVCITGLGVSLIKRNKFSRYIILVITITSISPITKAQDIIKIDFEINTKFKSQNVMEASYTGYEPRHGYPEFVDYWEYYKSIKRFYIQNEINEISEYVYKFDVSEEKNEKVTAYLVENEEDNNYFDLYLQADGIIYPNVDSSNYFYQMYNLDMIDNIEGLDTRYVTKMENMFHSTGSNSDIFTLDLSSFDTSNVIDMSQMFYQTGYNSINFTLDLGDKFDTSKVEDMYGMFYSTGYVSKNFTLDLGDNFDTSNVTIMSYMFRYTGMSSELFTLDLGDKFDTSNVTNMFGMFDNTGRNSSVFTLDLGDKFNTSNVTDMQDMFSGTGYNSTNFTLDLGDKFDTGKVTNMSGMFYQTGYNSKKFTLDLSNFDLSNVISMTVMFYETGYNSTELNTTITINTVLPNHYAYNYIFTGVATKPGSKITVNYTSETSDLVDKMIATKSSNSNVVKGVRVD